MIKKLSKNSRGFAHLELVLALIVMTAVAVIGYKVLTNSHAATPVSAVFTSSSKESSVSAVNETGVVSTIAGPSTSDIYSTPSYSHDRSYTAYYDFVPGYLGSGTVSQNIKIYNTNTLTTSSISIPTTIDLGGGINYTLSWYPDDSKIVFSAAASAQVNSNLIYTVNRDGTGLTMLPNLPDYGTITSISVTNNGRYIVFTTPIGVYRVQPGYAPVRIMQAPANGGCWDVIPRPGTNTGLAWMCNSADKTTVSNQVYKFAIGDKAAKSIFSSSYQVGSSNSNYASLMGMAWSPTGSNLALNLVYQYGSTASCSSTLQQTVWNLNLSTMVSTVVGSSNPVPTPCSGGGTLNTEDIGWSPDGNYIAYSTGLPYQGTSSSALYIAPASGNSAAKLIEPDSTEQVNW